MHHKLRKAPEELDTICPENSRMAFDAMTSPQLVRELAHWLFLLRITPPSLQLSLITLKHFGNACRQAISILSRARVPCFLAGLCLLHPRPSASPCN